MNKLKLLWHNNRLPHLHTEENVSDSPMFVKSGYLITEKQLRAVIKKGFDQGWFAYDAIEASECETCDVNGVVNDILKEITENDYPT